jgi:hypothetical protein
MASSARRKGTGPPKGPGLFATILDSKTYVDETYIIEDTGILSDIRTSLGSIYEANATIRHYIDSLPHYPYCALDYAHPRAMLIDMASVAEASPISRADLYAIDGTPMTPHLRYSAVQMFAVAVMGMSYATLDTPERCLAKTNTTFLETHAPITEWDKLVTWIRDQDIEESNQSWPTTFREYVEREYALRQQRCFTLIDGPLLTQNLLTQDRGRRQLTDLLDSSMTLCGVIKSIKASTNAHRILAQALKPGEALLIESTHDLIHRRNVHEEPWIDPFFEGLRARGHDIWRGVYRPMTKAFGFECDIKHLDRVVAMLWHERDVHHLGHEIPFLLNQVDAHLRATFNAQGMQHHLTYTLGLDLSQDELFDEMDERDFR